MQIQGFDMPEDAPFAYEEPRSHMPPHERGFKRSADAPPVDDAHRKRFGVPANGIPDLVGRTPSARHLLWEQQQRDRWLHPENLQDARE